MSRPVSDTTTQRYNASHAAADGGRWTASVPSPPVFARSRSTRSREPEDGAHHLSTWRESPRITRAAAGRRCARRLPEPRLCAWR